jgi:photosystem II stability/assembly factor-like uncharacterized protein
MKHIDQRSATRAGTVLLALAAALAPAAVRPAGAAVGKTAPAKVASASALDPRIFKEMAWRPVGPANMGGRVSDFAVVEKNPGTFFVGLATGGVFKTTNQGTTWSAVFEKQPVASVGAVAVWQKNPDVVWVGTGEANNRNSSSWGNGVYRSLDGGASWDHMGLDATCSIARVITDPADSATVYVAAPGRLWGESPERGVYVTRDAGKSWTLSLKVDARTGACDLAMDPSNPRTLYAAFYARRRTPWSYAGGGTSGGIFKSEDGGGSWHKLGGGLPASTGRIGLDVCRKDPHIVYAVVESGEGGQIGTMDNRSRSGGVFRSDDGGEHWTRQSPWTPRSFYFSQIRVQPDDDRRVYLLGVDLWVSDDAGKTFRPGGGKNLHPDFHAMWIDPSDGNRVLTGSDGGVYLSHDRTASWDFINNLAIGEYYNIALDMREPYRIYGGLQDNQSWGGPSATRFESDSWLDDRHDGMSNADWFCLGGGDGFHVAVDPTDPDLVYYESQGGNLSRVNLATGKERFLRPAAREGSPDYRFSWNTPFALSPHDPSVLWMGGNHLFRLYEHGDRWEEVSPDLSTQDPAKMVSAGSGAESYCTIVTLAESPVRAGVLWVGTDDGKVWVSEDAGAHWSDRTAALRGVPAGLWVSRIEASHKDAGTAFVAVDGHRSDRFEPWLLVTRDYGKTWKSIAGDLPRNGPVQVIREDPVNQDLWFAGTEFGLFMTLDGGAHWIPFGEGLPTVAVDDIQIHPRDHDLVAATHGRSLYVMDDITPLQHWTKETAAAPVTLFPPRPATAFHARTASGLWGQRMFTAKNPAFGAYFNYYVKEWTGETVSLAVTDSAGKAVRKLNGPGTPGLHRVVWDLQREARERLPRSEWAGQSDFVAPGTYTVELSYGKAAKQKQTVDVKHAPGTADPAP